MLQAISFIQLIQEDIELDKYCARCRGHNDEWDGLGVL